MKYWLMIAVVSLFGSNGFCVLAQHRPIEKEIDAVNNLSFEEKISNPAISIRKNQKI